MADSQSEEETNFRTETKYKQYSAAVERALKSFELSTEWHDLISSLARLNKVLLAYMQYPVVPFPLIVSKRLTQCLHPNLPGGVHLKALDVYKAIFDRIGHKGLVANLMVYSSALFPILGYASMSVRPHLLGIYEKYYVPLGEELLPSLHGFVLGLLPGLEDESEHTERIYQLLDTLCENTDQSAFFGALWRCILGSPECRLPATNFLLSKLNKKVTAEDQVYCLGGNLLLVVSAVCAALLDKNVLVERSILDIIIILFPLHQPFLLAGDVSAILTSALETLLKRDISLNRRLFAWLLGTQVDKSCLANRLQPTSPREKEGSNRLQSSSAARIDELSIEKISESDSGMEQSLESAYFEAYSKKYLVLSLKEIIARASLAAKSATSKLDCIIPYRMLRSLMDRSEIGASIINDIMLDVVVCLKQQLDILGGLNANQMNETALMLKRSSSEELPSKKLGKKGVLKIEILQSANLLFNSLDATFLWTWMSGLLASSFGAVRSQSNGEKEQKTAEGEDQTNSDSAIGGFEQLQDRRENLHLEQTGVADVASRNGKESLKSHHSLQHSLSQESSQISPVSSLAIIKFLLQSLPLDSMESAHQFYIPQLLMSLLSEILKAQSKLALMELHCSLSLVSYIIHELMTSPSSHMSSLATTPSTPVVPGDNTTPLKTPTRSLAERQTSEDGFATGVEVFDEIRLQIISDYLSIFSNFLSERLLGSSPENKASGRKNLHHVLSSACHVLLLVAQLAVDVSPAVPQESFSKEQRPPWLSGLMTVCTKSHDCHVILQALETLLSLIEMHSLTTQVPTLPNTPAERGSSLLRNVAESVTSDSKFIMVITELLWKYLSSSLHVESAALLSWLHSLLVTSSSMVCEKVILERFASEGLNAYQSFAVLWQFTPPLIHRTTVRPFNRALLRMLEGLKSEDVAVKHFVQSWVRFTVTKKTGLQQVLQPLVKMLLEAGSLRREYTRPIPGYRELSAKDALKDPAYAKYYYASLGITDPFATLKKDQYSDHLLLYNQVFDAGQVLYALSLLQSTIAVDPLSIITCMGVTVVDTTTYISSSHQHGGSNKPSHFVPVFKKKVVTHEDSPKDSRSTPTAGQPPVVRKSVLELLLSSCVDFLRSEYPESLEASLDDHLQNVRVKLASADVLNVVLCTFAKILSRTHKEPSLDHVSESEADSSLAGGAGVVNVASFVTALMALCDVQKIALLQLAHVVQILRSLANDASSQKKNVWIKLSRFVTTSDLNSPVTLLQSLFVHLLKLTQSLITLDTQCSIVSPSTTTPMSSSASLPAVSDTIALKDSSLPPVLSNLSTASQPFFHAFMSEMLSDSSLSHLHEHLLSMFVNTMPNLLGHQLDELAPKILKQICSSLEKSLQSGKSGNKIVVEVLSSLRSHDKVSSSQKVDVSSQESSFLGKLAVLYLETVVSIIHWCLFGDLHISHAHPEEHGKLKLHHHSLNLFWEGIRVAQVENSDDALSPTSKQPSTIAWLFGVFSTAAQKGEVSSENTNSTHQPSLSRPRVGGDSRAAQYIAMLLPAVYNAITELWRSYFSGGSNMSRIGSNSVLPGGGLEGLAAAAGGGVSTGSWLFEEKTLERRSRLESEDVKHLLSQLLCVLAQQEPTNFFSSISHIWLEWNLETKVQASKKLNRRKEAFIDMLHKIKVLPLEEFILGVQATLSDIAHSEEFESGMLRQKYLLHFLYKYISSTQQSSDELAACGEILVAFLKERYHLSYNPNPEYLFNSCHVLCMLTSILHVFVCRVPAPDPKKQKKERKDLQDITHKLCEVLSMAANVGIAQADYVVVEKKDEEVLSTFTNQTTSEERVDPVPEKDTMSDQSTETTALSKSDIERGNDAGVPKGGHLDSEKNSEHGSPAQQRKHHQSSLPTNPAKSESADDKSHSNSSSGPNVPPPLTSQPQQGGIPTSTSSSTSELQLPAIQALAVLSNVLSHFIDCVFGSADKDKIISLLKAVMNNVWPHLRNHSPECQQCYNHAVKLLSSFSGFQVTRKAWRREVFELFLAPDFFLLDLNSLQEWKIIVDNLMTQDQVTFRDLLARLHSSGTSGVVNLFSSLEQEVLTGARLLKRMGFAILSGEMDQYVKYLPDIQEKISEYLKTLRYPPVCSEALLTFRVLLLKLSPPHLMAFWPAITSELLSLLGQLENDLSLELSTSSSPTSLPKTKLQLYLSTCKLLDTAMSLPPEFLPHFQLLQWGFTSQSAYTDTKASIVTRLCRQYQLIGSSTQHHQSPTSTPPHLHMSTISSLRELKPLFDALYLSNRSRLTNHSQFLASARSGLSSEPRLSASSSQQCITQLALVERVILQDFIEVF